MRQAVSTRSNNVDSILDLRNQEVAGLKQRTVARVQRNAGRTLAYINWNLTHSGTDTSQGVICDEAGKSTGVVVTIDAIKSISTCVPQTFGYALYEIEVAGLNASNVITWYAVRASSIPPDSGLGSILSVTGLDSSSRLLNGGSPITNVVGGSTLNNVLPVAFTSGGSTDPSTYDLANPLLYEPTTAIPFSASISPPFSGPVFVASGTGHAAGIVPDPGPTAGITRFVREDATFAVPPYPPIFVPAGTLASSGLVPAPPLTASPTLFMCADGTWKITAGASTFATYQAGTTTGTLTSTLTKLINSGALLTGSLTGWNTTGTFTAPANGLYSFSASVWISSGGFAVSPGNLYWSLFFSGPGGTPAVFGGSQILQSLTPSSSVLSKVNVKCDIDMSSGQTCTLSATATLTGGSSGSCVFNLDALTITKLP